MRRGLWFSVSFSFCSSNSPSLWLSSLLFLSLRESGLSPSLPQGGSRARPSPRCGSSPSPSPSSSPPPPPTRRRPRSSATSRTEGGLSFSGRQKRVPSQGMPARASTCVTCKYGPHRRTRRVTYGCVKGGDGPVQGRERRLVRPGHGTTGSAAARTRPTATRRTTAIQNGDQGTSRTTGGSASSRSTSSASRGHGRDSSTKRNRRHLKEVSDWGKMCAIQAYEHSTEVHHLLRRRHASETCENLNAINACYERFVMHNKPTESTGTAAATKKNGCNTRRLLPRQTAGQDCGQGRAPRPRPQPTKEPSGDGTTGESIRIGSSGPLWTTALLLLTHPPRQARRQLKKEEEPPLPTSPPVIPPNPLLTHSLLLSFSPLRTLQRLSLSPFSLTPCIFMHFFRASLQQHAFPLLSHSPFRLK